MEKLVEECSKNTEENKGVDSIDEVEDTFKSKLDSIEEEFDKLTGLAWDKKIILRNLPKLIWILVSRRYNTVDKAKQVIKITIDTTLKLWPEASRP